MGTANRPRKRLARAVNEHRVTLYLRAYWRSDVRRAESSRRFRAITAWGLPPYELPTLGLLAELSELGGLARDRGVIVGYGVSRLVGMQTTPLDGVRKVATTKILDVVGTFIITAGAQGESSHGGICFGDSGGPLFLANEDPNLIVGVASVVRHEGCQAYAGHIRLDTPTALAFLGQYVTP
jgi:hypothetical protein